jgi:hypothetical protein
MDQKDIERRFTHHPPNAVKINAHENIRATARRYAEDLNLWLPEGREKSLAITHLEEVVFWSNAAIARQEA